MQRNRIIKQAMTMLREELKTDVISEERQTYSSLGTYFQLEIGSEANEVFGVAFFNNRGHMIAFEKMYYGTVNRVNTPFRAIIQRIFHHNAQSVIFTHNHPSGDLTASDADIKMTRKFGKLLKEIDCPLRDHFIVGTTGYVTLRGRIRW